MAALYAAMSMADDATNTSPVVPAAPNFPEAEHAPKKPRTHQACEICRERKTKCTGERPACAQCMKRGIPCSYDRKSTPRRSDGILQAPKQHHPPQQLMTRPIASINRPFQPPRIPESDNVVVVDSSNSNRFRVYLNESQHRDDALEMRNGIKRPYEGDHGRSYDDILPPISIGGFRPSNMTSPDNKDNQSTTSLPPIDIARRNMTSPDTRDVRTAPASALGLPAPRPQQTPTPAPEENGVYGLSSNKAFLNKLSGEHPAETTPSTVLGQAKSRVSTPRYRLPERLSTSDTSTMDSLPRRNRADDFLRCYWDFMHPLFPMLHKVTFVTKYQQLWESDAIDASTEYEDSMFMSALHLVFAIGCRFSSLIPNDQKMALADTFYQRSRQSFGYDVLDTSSLLAIQVLLLQVTYLASTHHAVRCWNAIGLAVRASQSIGLHLGDMEHDAQQTQLQIEMRRRIWHTCVTLDRCVAMVFGRPATIQTSGSPLPSLIDDEYIGGEKPGRQPDGHIPQLGLFVHSIKLFDVLQDVLTTFYSGQNESGQALRVQVAGAKSNNKGEVYDMVNSVTSLSKRIDMVEKDIPAWLLAEPDERTENHVKLQQRVLRSRLHYVRLLTLRPLLMVAPSRDRGGRLGTFEDDIAAACCLRCIDTSKSLIHYTSNNLSDLHRSAPWHTTIYTCAALSVFLAALKLGQVAWDDAELHKAWDAAIAILETYQDSVAAAAEGIQTLQTLKRKLLSSLKKTQEGASDSQYSTPLSLQDLSGVGLGFDDINDAWFSQHFLDSNWLDTTAAM